MNVPHTLQELVSQSELLKISLEERTKIHSVLKNCTEWAHDTCSLLEDVGCLFNMHNLRNASINDLIPKIGFLITKTESILGTGSSLGFDFEEIPKLQTACSTLQWCNEALSFCTATPTLQVSNSILSIISRPLQWACYFSWCNFVLLIVSIYILMWI